MRPQTQPQTHETCRGWSSREGQLTGLQGTRDEEEDFPHSKNVLWLEDKIVLMKSCCWAVKDTRILGLQRGGIQSEASDEAWSLRACV